MFDDVIKKIRLEPLASGSNEQIADIWGIAVSR